MDPIATSRTELNEQGLLFDPSWEPALWAEVIGCPLRARQLPCLSGASVAGPAGAEAEEEASGTPDGAGQCGWAAPEPAGPAVGGAGPPGGVLPQQQWQHQLPRYLPLGQPAQAPVLWLHTLALLWGAPQGLPACAGEGLTPSGCAQAGCGSQLRWREAGRGRLGPGARGPCICSGILRLWESRKSLPCSCFSSCFLEYRLCARGRARPAEGQQPFRRECASHVTRHSFRSHHHRSPAHL